jgi:dienelactone hydrolase
VAPPAADKYPPSVVLSGAMRSTLLVLLLVAFVAGCGGGTPAKDDPVEPELAKRFEFPRLGATLREGERTTRKGVVQAEIAYPSQGPDNVTGFIVRPPKPAKDAAGVVFMHGGGGRASDFVGEAHLLARRGAVALTIDSPFTRSPDEAIREGKADVDPTYETMVQNVQDLLRGLDILVTQYGVDPDRLAVVGYSMGAQPAALAAALDPRVRALVLMAGRALPSGLPSDPHERELFGAIDTVDYVDNLAPTHLLLQGAEFDSVIPRSEMEMLAGAASEPKEIRWYQSDHDLGEQAGRERIAWLVDQLGLR